MDQQTEKQIRAWIYLRRRSTENQLLAQRAALEDKAEENGYQVVGFSTDEGDDPLIYRPGLRAAAKAVKKEWADVVLVTRLPIISHHRKRVLSFMKVLQTHGAWLETTYTQLPYELHILGVEQELMHRARKKHLGVPWK